jgi:alkylation response protein AidB-like acyl-CoA dehydrogenase
MDFLDTKEEAAFRAGAREWLVLNAAEYSVAPTQPYTESEFVERARAWLRRKAEGGYGAILWPKAVGGRDGTLMEQVIFEEEEGRYHVPNGPFVNLGMRMGVPTLLKHGSQAQIERFAQATMRGELAWCQLFSEPGAGSDLAALRTKAARDGDRWIVNGQKVWSSWAHHADWGILLARTDPSLPKHKGITFFLLNMRTPGIEVRPIRQISGKSDFNETFLTNVEIPDDARVGDVNGGWAVAMTTLTSERLGGAASATGVNSTTIMTRAQERGLIDDRAVRQQIAKWHALEQGLRNFRYRLLTKLSKGESAGALGAISKLMSYRKLQELTAYAMDLRGYAGLFAEEGDVLQSQILDEFIWSSAMRIAGGADEVLRNQLAERVLSLPQDPRTDKDTPFNQLRQ